MLILIIAFFWNIARKGHGGIIAVGNKKKD
jgi:hypothetical protein